MGACGAALELWMELRCDKPRMVGKFDHFDETIIGGSPAYNEPMRLHTFAELVIELIAMAMALENNRLAVGLIGFCAGCEAANPITQAHRTTFIRDIALSQHQIDYR